MVMLVRWRLRESLRRLLTFIDSRLLRPRKGRQLRAMLLRLPAMHRRQLRDRYSRLGFT
jgi:hypothetical protein